MVRNDGAVLGERAVVHGDVWVVGQTRDAVVGWSRDASRDEEADLLAARTHVRISRAVCVDL